MSTAGAKQGCGGGVGGLKGACPLYPLAAPKNKSLVMNPYEH